MFTNANVRLANEVVLSARSTGATQAALAEGNGASENAYGRPHAPRSGAPKNAALTGLLLDISSTGELRSSAPHRSRISECAPASLRRLDRIRASYRLRIGYSRTDQVSQIWRSILSRGRTAQSVTHRPDYRSTPIVAPACGLIADRNPPNCGQRGALILRNRVDPESDYATGLLRRLHNSPTCARDYVLPKQLTGSANDCSAHQIRRKKQ